MFRNPGGPGPGSAARRRGPFPGQAQVLSQRPGEPELGMFWVQPPGRAWGIAGYSEGGDCTANLALVYRLRYGAADVLRGYFAPLKDQLGNPPRLVNPFGQDQRMRRTNTPRQRVTRLPVSASIPQFWLRVGSRDATGLPDARGFQRLLPARQPDVWLDVVAGGGHTMATPRSIRPPSRRPEGGLPELSRGGCCPGRPGGVSAGAAVTAARHPGREPGRAARTAGAGRHPAPGAGRLPGTARRATG